MAKEDTSARIEKLSQLIDIPTRNDKGVYEIGPDGYNKMLETIGNDYRHRRYPDARKSEKVAQVLRRVADELAL